MLKQCLNKQLKFPTQLNMSTWRISCSLVSCRIHAVYSSCLFTSRVVCCCRIHSGTCSCHKIVRQWPANKCSRGPSMIPEMADRPNDTKNSDQHQFRWNQATKATTRPTSLLPEVNGVTWLCFICLHDDEIYNRTAINCKVCNLFQFLVVLEYFGVF